MVMSTPAAARAAHADAPEADLIDAVRAGDRARFAVLVQRHNQALFRACRAVLGDDAEAEDAVQAAWIAVYRALAGFRGDASFRTWATRIAVNEASARLRRRGRLAEVPLVEVTTMTIDGGAESAVSDGELGRFLEQRIDALPEGMRTVLVLRDILELDTAETAACLGIGEEAVRVRLHRARRALADSLTEAMGAELSRVWRFDGERCARVLDGVMAAIG
jgi:RNA polymerase sigma-70 factor (ECF subfamily)